MMKDGYKWVAAIAAFITACAVVIYVGTRGGEIEIPIIAGKSVNVRIPAPSTFESGDRNIVRKEIEIESANRPSRSIQESFAELADPSCVIRVESLETGFWFFASQDYQERITSDVVRQLCSEGGPLDGQTLLYSWHAELFSD